MADPIYSTITFTKHNLDGVEDVYEVYITPREELRARERIISVKRQQTIVPNGIHLDRFNANGVLDNPNLQLDTTASPPEEVALINPFNHHIEKFYDQEFIDTDNSNGTHDATVYNYELLDKNFNDWWKFDGNTLDSRGTNNGTFKINASAYYPFNGNANDESVNSNNGTVNGATLTTDHLGNSNNAYHFELNQNISLPPTMPSSTDYTISCYIKFPLPNLGITWSTAVSNDGGSYHQLLFSSGGDLGLYDLGFYPCGYNASSLTGWHMVTTTSNKTTGETKFYIDGVQVGSTVAHVLSSGNISSLGNYRSTGNQQIGDLSDVLILNKALSDSEVSNLYNITSRHKLDKPFVDGHISGTKAIEFDGVSSYVETNYDFPAMDEITISFWGKFDTIKSQSVIAAKNDNINNRVNIHFPWGNGKLYWDFGDVNNGGRLYVDISQYQNQTHHWVFTADNTGMKIYIDGTLLAQQTQHSTFNGGQGSLLIGTFSLSNYYFAGKIQDVQIYNKALTATEVNELYTTGLPYTKLTSKTIQFLDNKAFQKVRFVVNNDNSDGLKREIDIGDGTWRTFTTDTLNITDSISFGSDFDGDLDFDLTGVLFPNKLRYRVTNNTGQPKTVDKVDIVFEYYK